MNNLLGRVAVPPPEAEGRRFELEGTYVGPDEERLLGVVVEVGIV